MSDFQTAVNAIDNITDLASLNRLRIHLIETMEWRGRNQFRYGQTVEFDARGRLWTGTVEKINAKTIKVKCAGMTWRVAPNLLRPAAKAA